MIDNNLNNQESEKTDAPKEVSWVWPTSLILVIVFLFIQTYYVDKYKKEKEVLRLENKLLQLQKLQLKTNELQCRALIQQIQLENILNHSSK